MRGSSMSLSARVRFSASRSTLSITCAEALCIGVFSAAMHSGSQSFCVSVCILAVLRQQFGDGHVVADKRKCMRRNMSMKRAALNVRRGQALRFKQRNQQVQRGGQPRCFERKLVVQVKLQRQTQKILFDVSADLFDHAQGLAVATEQQVLAVVQLRIVVQTPRARPPSCRALSNTVTGIPRAASSTAAAMPA